jgi:hypothetical protein
MNSLNNSKEITNEQAKLLVQTFPKDYMTITETNGKEIETSLVRLQDNRSWKITINK